MKVKKILKYSALVFILFACVDCSSQADKGSGYMAEVYKICPKADIVNVEQKVESIEVEFLCGNEPMSVLFDKQGNFLYKERKYTPDDMFLSKVEKKIQKNYAGWTIDEYALIETKDTSFVKLEVVKNGVEETLFFTQTGKFYKFKNFATTESWSKEMLKNCDYYASLSYDLLKPKKVFDLPELLKEISGISLVDDSIAFCVQDELGAVFQVNLDDESVSQVARFTDVGDFEDLQVVGSKVYVLRSDGAIFSVDYENYNGTFEQKMVDIPCMNMEGLFYNADTKQFLISCKEPSLGKRATTKKQHTQDVAVNADSDREIYTFDLQNKPAHLLSMKIDEIRAFVKEHYGETFSLETARCNPSALAINPITKELYILSAMDKMIVVYAGTTLKNVMLLPPEDFYKPEGIDFLSNGDMVISSEGQKKGYLQGQIIIVPLKK